MEKVKIVALGDSITKGMVLTEQNTYSQASESFVEILRHNNSNVEIDNLGKFGCTIDYGHHIVNCNSEEIAGAKYVIVEYGGNDCDFHWKNIALNPTATHLPKTPLEDFKHSFTELLQRIRALGAKPIILSLPPISSEAYFNFISRGMTPEQRDNILAWMGGNVEAIGRWHELYNEALYDIALSTNTHLLDITRPFCSHAGGWQQLICPDGIHPNVAGHRLIASSILSSVVLSFSAIA